jgi:hypothetical protein
MAFRGLKVLIRDKENHENHQNSFLVDENPSKPLKTLWTVNSTNQQGRLAWNFKRQHMILRFLRVFSD